MESISRAPCIAQTPCHRKQLVTETVNNRDETLTSLFLPRQDRDRYETLVLLRTFSRQRHRDGDHITAAAGRTVSEMT